MKTAFVLSGGGAKGAFQAGALLALHEKGIKPDVIYGTSVGSLNGVGWAYLGPEKTVELWKGIKGRGDILTSNWWKILFNPPGWYSMKPLRKKLEAIVKGPGSCEVNACYTDLVTGTAHYASNRKLPTEAFRMFVEASSSIPTFMEPVCDRFVDGGVREIAPLKQAIIDGAEKIYAILCNPLTENPTNSWEKSWPHMVSYGLRAIDIMEQEVFYEDMKLCRQRNNEEGWKKIDLQVLAPAKFLYETLEFDPKKLAAALKQGYEVGKAL